MGRRADRAGLRDRGPAHPGADPVAAEDVLRRHGPAKANVVDIARALGVSHGTVYRHFPSKQALREAVTRRWLDHFHHELAPVIDLHGGWNPLPATVKYDVLRDVLTLLTISNATAQQRAALITVLTNYEGVTALEAVKDRRGREGHGVDIPSGRGVVRVIFDRDTSELLEWSEPGETHTFVKAGHVAKIGERP